MTRPSTLARLLAPCLAALALACGPGARAQDAKAQMAKLYEAAKKEGPLTLTAGTNPPWRDYIMKHWQSDFPGLRINEVTIDMSDMSSAFRAIGVGQSASFTIEKRESNSYLAHVLVSGGSRVNGTDRGTREEFETRGSSIDAHVQGAGDDDEALSQQHRDSNLRRDQDDDHDNCCAPDN